MHVASNLCSVTVQSLGSHPYRNYRTKLPSYFMYDDHELFNDWDAVDDLAVRDFIAQHTPVV